ncbi:PBECR3 domain-containing polyvalent protein, partial [Helicobacter salomonis]|uniref:PBECR3 domain-containing polyvalent protein n=1 Tax=Helicobacter salomonis TaxID=56878 RepID=UPI000CF01ACC
YYKYTQDPNLKDHIQKALEGFLRRDIKQGVNTLFENIPEQFRGKFTQLFEVALQDYATMKQTLRHVKKLGLRDAHKSEEEALNSLLKFAKGQGESVDNFSQLAKGLNASNREVLELHMLERLFKRSLVEAQDLSVFDSHHFLQNLAKLKEGTFQSQGAKDFIEIAQGFHKLFNQDAQIARSLKPTTGGKMGSSIATSVSGAAQFQITKALFDFVVRTMIPYIPFAKALNDKVSGAAFRYHIKAALHKSHSVSDFKQHLNTLAKRVEFDNATKALIREIEGGLPSDEPPPGGGTPRAHLEDGGSAGKGGGEPPNSESKSSNVESDRGGGKRSFEEIKQLIDSSPSKGRDMVLIGRENFSPAVVDYLLEFKGPSKKIAIEHLETSKAQELGFKYPTDVRRTIDKSEILHVLERHGENGTIKQARKQPAVTKEDIAKYPQYTDEADIKVLGKNHAGEVIISGKQINGHYVVVEQIRKGQNELAFKTMYFERGDLRNNPAFDSVMLQEHPKHPSYEPGLGQMTDTKTSMELTTPPLNNQPSIL